MRVFYALPLPPLIQEHCLNIINDLKQHHHLSETRWTKPDHLHITLRFLENIDEDILDTLNTLLQEKLLKYPAFTISTRRLLLFPTKKPHIIALGVHLNMELANLVRELNQTLSTEGITLVKRPFVAHITLGRFRESLHTDEIHFKPINSTDDKITHVVLFKSEPTETGSDYKPLKTFKLGQEKIGGQI